MDSMEIELDLSRPSEYQDNIVWLRRLATKSGDKPTKLLPGVHPGDYRTKAFAIRVVG